MTVLIFSLIETNLLCIYSIPDVSCYLTISNGWLTTMAGISWLNEDDGDGDDDHNGDRDGDRDGDQDEDVGHQVLALRRVSASVYF